MGVDRGILNAMNDHKAKIAGPHFLFSAENPKFPDKNSLALSHEQVLHHLKHAGYDAHEVQGHYGAPEKSIVVYDILPHQADQLHNMAARLGQDSSIHSNGKQHEMRFHHGADAGKKILGQGTQWHNQQPKDMFTTLPGGSHHFTHNFNFAAPIHPLAPASTQLKKSEIPQMGNLPSVQESPNNAALNKEEKPTKLVHYSNKPNLTHIDPKFKGTGIDSRTKGRDSAHGHSFFYREGTEPEHLVANHSAHKYTTSIHPKTHKLYDIGTDPEHHVHNAIKENQGALDMDRVHEKLKAAGYHGFHNSKHHELHNVVAMYHPMKVESHEPVR